MKKKRLGFYVVLIIIVIFIVWQVLGFFTSKAFKNATVTGVADGDTIYVIMDDSNKKERIRFIGINCPEYGEKYFTEAKNYTKEQLLNKRIRLTFDKQRRDKYNRILAYVFVDENFFNDQIIKDGWAYAFLKYPFKRKYMKKFSNSQIYAVKRKLGIWKE